MWESHRSVTQDHYNRDVRVSQECCSRSLQQSEMWESHRSVAQDPSSPRNAIFTTNTHVPKPQHSWKITITSTTPQPRWRQYAPSKCRESITLPLIITTQKTWMIKPLQINTAYHARRLEPSKTVYKLVLREISATYSQNHWNTFCGVKYRVLEY